MSILLSLAGIRFDRGMGEYIKEFLPFLCKEFKEELLVVSNKSIPDDILRIINSYNSILYKKEIPYPLFEQFVIPKIIRKYNVKVAYFPANTFPLIKPKNVKYIVTIHDLMFLDKSLKPRILHQKIGKLYRTIIIKYGVKQIDMLICNSNSTLKNFKKIFGNLENIKEAIVIYNPFNLKNASQYDDSIVKILNLDVGKYIYTISGTSPNKNFEFLLKSFSKLKSFYPNLKLAVSGINKNSDIELYRPILKSLDIQDSVIFTGYVTEAQKKSLIKNCKAFVFLSKDEGFGRPIIEALMENAAVVASDIDIFKEIGGKFVHYIDISNESSLSNFFLNNKLNANNKDEVIKHIKSNFDVEYLANKLINLIHLAFKGGAENEY